MKIQIILISLFIFVIGCQSNPKSLGDYEDVNKTFEADEVQDLEKIVNFFNESICESENLESTNVLNCYEQYFKRMLKAEETGIVEIQISYEAQEKLMKEINPRSFDQIWTYRKTWRKGTDTLEVVDINYDGKYIKFLKEFGKENIKAKYYAERFEATGDISPSMFADVLVNYKDYDVRDERVKLLIAIHYLTQNDQFKVREK
ncbi:MAG: hypothetical protein AAF740_05250, partial [Bacteroidota bacterium]